MSIPGATTNLVDCLIILICTSGVDSASNQFDSTPTWTNADLTNITEIDGYQTNLGNGAGSGFGRGRRQRPGRKAIRQARLMEPRSRR